MSDLFNVLMRKAMVPGQPAPPSGAVGMFSPYQPPPPDRKPGWTQSGGGQPPKPQPNQMTQAVGGGPGAASPSPGGAPGEGGNSPAPPQASMPMPPPPNPPKGVPPQAARFANAQMAQDLWRQGINPTTFLNSLG